MHIHHHLIRHLQECLRIIFFFTLICNTLLFVFNLHCTQLPCSVLMFMRFFECVCNTFYFRPHILLSFCEWISCKVWDYLTTCVAVWQIIYSVHLDGSYWYTETCNCQFSSQCMWWWRIVCWFYCNFGSRHVII